jgi:SAM-dependent methyltransferase
VSSTYARVDDSAVPGEAADWQERIGAWPAVKAYKQRTYALLGAETPLLDVGCGTGIDVAALGDGAVGVDRSAVMCQRARARGVTVGRGEASALPFPSGRFAGVRADRVIQHVEEPERTLAELGRVTRPGGRLVIADPDQGSLVIEVPGVRAELVESVRRRRRDAGYRNGTFARRLPATLRRLGLGDVTLDAFALVLTDPDDAFGVPSWVRLAREHGAAVTEADEREWDRGVGQARVEGGFVYSVTYFVASGRTPL